MRSVWLIGCVYLRVLYDFSVGVYCCSRCGGILEVFFVLDGVGFIICVFE